MCGRFALDIKPEKLKSRYQLGSDPPLFAPHYNVAPGMMVPVVLNNKARVAVLARWGLIPHWAKDPKIGYRMINARAETVAEKNSFRSSFISKRCLVPASGFYEWKKVDHDKIPYYITLSSSPVFSLAGLYDTWSDVEGRELTTCTILTTSPNSLMAPIHDRMPVILNEKQESDWLNPNIKNVDVLKSFLCSFPVSTMRTYPISKLVNNPENDSAKLIVPLQSN